MYLGTQTQNFYKNVTSSDKKILEKIMELELERLDVQEAPVDSESLLIGIAIGIGIGIAIT